jgi:hypothetical protein
MSRNFGQTTNLGCCGQPPSYGGLLFDSDEEAIGKRVGALTGVLVGWATLHKVDFVREQQSWLSRMLWPVSLAWTGRMIGGYVGRKFEPPS